MPEALKDLLEPGGGCGRSGSQGLPLLTRPQTTSAGLLAGLGRGVVGLDPVGSLSFLSSSWAAGGSCRTRRVGA
eukprot:9957614-Alexandrium_andersonii.AAC.1